MLIIKAGNKGGIQIWNFYYEESGPRQSTDWNKTVRSGKQEEKIFSHCCDVLDNNLNEIFFFLTFHARMPHYLQLSLSALRCCHFMYNTGISLHIA
mgnify:FL=1